MSLTEGNQPEKQRFVSPKAFGEDVRRKEDRGGAKRTINQNDSTDCLEVVSWAIKRSNWLSRLPQQGYR